MERKAITCPLTGHLEHITLDRTSLGLVVDRCTQFSPTDEVCCSRECARRLDHRDQLVDDQRADRVLVLYAGGARARDPAGALADALRDDALVVEVADADCRGLPPPEDYDAVAIVAPLRSWGYPLATTQYLRAHTESLRAIPTWLVSLSSSGDASATRLWREVVPRPIMRALPIAGRMKEIGRLIADDM